jgi:PhnB protein
MQLNPYLSFSGNCKEAFEYYAEALHGKVELMTYRGSPAAEHAPPEWQDKIMHAHLDAGGSSIMASDSPPGNQQKMGGFSVAIGINDPPDQFGVSWMVNCEKPA